MENNIDNQNSTKNVPVANDTSILKIRFKTSEKIKYAPVDIEIDGKFQETDALKSVAKGYVQFSVAKGRHTISIRQNNFFNTSSSVGFARIVDSRMREGEESPFYVTAEITVNITDDTRFDLEFVPNYDDYKKSGFIKYDFKCKAVNIGGVNNNEAENESDDTKTTVEYSIDKCECRVDEYAKKRWAKINMFNVVIGFVIGVIFVVIGVLSLAEVQMRIFAIVALALSAALIGLSVFTMVTIIRRYKRN